MATLNEITDLRSNSHLLNRAAAALAKAAEDVRNEAAAVTNHAERFAWASLVLLTVGGPESEAKRAIWLVLQNVTIQDEYTTDPATGGATTDSDVQFVVNGLVNVLSGADTSA